MTGIVGQAGSRAVQVIIGVDTHQDEHVAVAIDPSRQTRRCESDGPWERLPISG